MLQVISGSYRMHDLLRQYATEKLMADEAAAIQAQEAHSAYFLEHLPERAVHLKSARRSATLTTMDSEVNDLQAAWKWACRQGHIPLLASSLEGLCLYFEMRVRFKEGEQACRLGYSAAPESSELAAGGRVLRARLLLWQANFLVLSGELAAASRLRQEAGALLDQLEAEGADARRPRAMYWQLEGEAQTELKNKLACYQRGVALYHEVGDAWRQARMLIWAGEYAMRLGDNRLALECQQEALRLAQQVGEPDTLLHSLRQNIYLNFILNRVDHARQLIQETKTYLEHVEEPPLRAVMNLHLGHFLNWIGRFPEAIQVLENAVPALRTLGYRYGVSYGSFTLGCACVFNGEYERGEEILKVGISEATQGEFYREAAGMLAMRGMAALARGQAVQALELIQESSQRYRSMQFSGELGWSLGGLALAQDMLDQHAEAQSMLREALHIAASSHSMAAMLTIMPAAIRLLARGDDLETALLVHYIAGLKTFLQNSRWYADVIGDEMKRRWASLPSERRAEIMAAAQQHTPFSIIPEVLARLEEAAG
jgi:tetratricopeptide (TPR) repeat protein